MADDQQTADQAVQDTPPAKEEGNESQGGQVQPTEGQGSESNATGENQGKGAEQSSSGDSGDQSGQGEAKPSRIERRIHDLLSKVKEVGHSQSQQPPAKSGHESIFTKEEIESGVVDPSALSQRIQSTVQSEVQKALQMDRMSQQYESSVKEHQADLESVKDVDPDLEAEAVKEYEALNYQIHPLTGQRVFVPAVKFSEIVAKIHSRAEKIAAKMAEKITEGNERHLKEVSSSAAVPSSGNVSAARSVKSDTTDFASFEKAYSS